MRHALALLLLSCALVAQDKPNSVDSSKKRATELQRMLVEGKITQADLNRMFEEGKISPTVMLMMNVADDAAPTPQAKPAAKVTKAAAAEAPNPAAVEKAAESKPKISPINVRDELIELIHQLKKEAGHKPHPPYFSDSQLMQAYATKYDSDMKAKTEAQRLLLQALVELAKDAAKDKPTKAWHSSLPPEPGEDGNWFRSK